MDRELLFRFLETTQPDTMAALRKIYNGQTEETIVKFILQSIDNKGSSLIETLKSGIEISNMHLDLLYGKPATDYNIDLVAKYNANIFSIMEEVWINDDQRIDLVVFLNGFAIATFELKCQSAGQNYRMAIKQYSEDRDPKNRLFLFKAGALVLAHALSRSTVGAARVSTPGKATPWMTAWTIIRCIICGMIFCAATA